MLVQFFKETFLTPCVHVFVINLPGSCSVFGNVICMYVYIYIYIYVCVCMCVCVCITVLWPTSSNRARGGLNEPRLNE